MSQNAQTPDKRLTDIFINYRRADTSGHAGRLERDLSNRFPGRVFMDIHNIEVGKDFTEAINDEVGKCGALIVMIGNQWLSITDPKTGKRRLDKPDDLVALEIAGALKRDIRVIPVLVEGATMPQEEDLPPMLAGLVRRNAIEITDTRWDYDVSQLIKVLEKICGSTPQPAEDTSEARQGMLSSAASGKSRAMKIALISIVALIAATVLVIYLSSGKDSTPQSQAGNTNLGGQSPANVAATVDAAKPPDAINRPQPQVVVKPSVVEIVSPVDGGRKWEWGGIEAPKTGEHEYHWEVELYGRNGYYKFSVYLNQAKKGGRADDFAALVNEMSQEIYVWDDDKDKWIVANASVPLDLEFDATSDGLSMTVTGKEVQSFYVSKSKTAILRILMPDQKEELKTVPVVYKES